MGRERWLIVAAHADDESKSASLIFTERKPNDVLIILVMRLVGEGRPYDRESWTPEEGINIRSTEMKRSSEFLKANELRWWLPPHPNNGNIVKTPETVKKMVQIMDEIKPTRIITHWGLGDSHPDHAGTAEVVKEAIRQINVPNELTNLYFFGEPVKLLSNFIPNHFVDISKPSLLASVLWTRCVHRSQVDFNTFYLYTSYFKKQGQKSGCDYADAFVMNKI